MSKLLDKRSFDTVWSCGEPKNMRAEDLHLGNEEKKIV